MAEGIRITNREDITYCFKDTKVEFESMRTPIFEIKNRQISDIMYLCCIYKKSDGAMFQVNLDATSSVKSRLMRERIVPWSMHGSEFHIICTFDKNGVVSDYELKYINPNKLTGYNFELVEDTLNPVMSSSSNMTSNPPVSSPSNEVVFKLLDHPTETAAVYALKLDTSSSFSSNQEDIAKLLTAALTYKPKPKITSGYVLGGKYVVTDVNKSEKTYTVNLIPLV